jgi:hypothetical protein
MGATRIIFRVFKENFKARENFGNLDLEGRLTVTWTLKKYEMKV